MVNACVFPGSFNPFHEGHKYVISQALKHGYKAIQIVIAQNPCKPINEFEKNFQVIQNWIDNNNLNSFITVNIHKEQVVDYMNLQNLNTIVRGYRNLHDLIYEIKLMFKYKKANKNIKFILFKTNKLYKHVSSKNLK